MSPVRPNLDLAVIGNCEVSALIDDRGRLLMRGGQFTQEVIRGDVQPTTGLTPFARWAAVAGLWPLWIGCALLVLACLALRRQS